VRRARRGVGLVAGRAEEDMDRVADDLGDRALVREHDLRHAFEIAAEQTRELLGIKRFDQRREARDVGEERRDLASFPAGRKRVGVSGEAAGEIG
jgi:hypothetical protein